MMLNLNPFTTGTVALGDLHVDHPPADFISTYAQYLIAGGVALFFILAGVALVMRAWGKSKEPSR